MDIILASQSPRRRQLLELMGLQFRVQTADIDETMDPDAPLAQEIAALSRRKAEAVRADALVIAADTMVCVEGRRLGKPRDEAEAFSMLRMLSGRTHTVLTGVCVAYKDRVETFVEESTIHFRPLSDAEIRAYIATGEPMDKAGAYAVQGQAALFISRLEGDFYNVMGLPICRLAQLLRGFGVQVLGDPSD